MNSKWMHMIAFSLVMAGALNWGLIGLINLNLVNALVGSWPPMETVVYILVGAAAVYVFTVHKGDCKLCGKK